MRRSGLLALLLAAGSASAEAPPVNGSQNSLDLQKARADALKTKGLRRAYTKAFDLSGLPEYKPSKQMTGVIRQWGSNYLADSSLEKRLRTGSGNIIPAFALKTSLKARS